MKKILIIISIIVGLLIAAVLAVVIVQPWREAMLKHAIKQLVPADLGQLTIRQVSSPSWAMIELQGMQLRPVGHLPDANQLVVDRLVVQPAWSVWSQGLNQLIRSSSVTISGLELYWRLKPENQSDQKRSNNKQTGFQLPVLVLPKLNINQSQVTVAGQNWSSGPIMMTSVDDEVNHIRLTTNQLSLTINQKRVTMPVTLDLVQSDKGWQIERGRLNDNRGGLQLLFSIALHEQTALNFETKLQVSNQQANNPFVDLWGTMISGHLSVSGTVQLPRQADDGWQGTMDLVLKKLRYNQFKIDYVAGDIRKQPSGWQADRWTLRQQDNQLTLTQLNWPGTIASDGPIPFWPSNLTVDLAINLNQLKAFGHLGQLSDYWQQAKLNALSASVQIREPMIRVAPAQLKFLQHDLTIQSFETDVLKLLGQPKQAKIQLVALFDQIPVQQLLLPAGLSNLKADLSGRIGLNGSWQAYDLESNLTVKNIDYRQTAQEPLVQADALSLSLTASGSELNVSGQGQARFQELVILPRALHRLQLSEVNLVLKDNLLEMPETRAVKNGGILTLQGRYDFSAPQTNGLQLSASGRQVLLWRSDTINTRGNVNLEITGPLADLVTAGRIELTQGHVEPRFNWQTLLQGVSRSLSGGNNLPGTSTTVRLSGPVLETMRFDVAVTSIQPLEIVSNLAKATWRPDLVLSGTGGDPALAGTVYVDQLAAYFPAGQINFANGLVREAGFQPESFKLAFQGSGRIRGYDINMAVTGPLNDPRIKLQSNPPIPQDQLVLLVLSGHIPRRQDIGQTSLAIGLNTALFLTRDTLAAWLSNGQSSDTILDNIELYVGREQSSSGQTSMELHYQAGENIILKGDSLRIITERDENNNYYGGLRHIIEME